MGVAWRREWPGGWGWHRGGSCLEGSGLEVGVVWRWVWFMNGYTIASRVYAPRFATLALVESVGGGGLICGI